MHRAIRNSSSMAESPSQASTPTASDTTDTTQYWCYHCEKRVPIETLANLSDVICNECKSGFVESISASLPRLVSPTSLTPDHVDASALGSQFLQVLRSIAEGGRDEDTPRHRSQDPVPEDDFLRIELDGWENDEDDATENDENRDDGDEEDDDDENENDNEGREDLSDDNVQDNIDNGDEEDVRRRRRDVLRFRLRDLTTRATTEHNRILDWAEILMGLEDNSIELGLEVPESDRYMGDPEDYVDAAEYEALLQNLAESDGGRSGAPPAAQSAVSRLPTVEIFSEVGTIVCAICKDMVCVGESATKLPCGHGYHGDCIVPWLASRNTCPVCRFELPTDDPQYEETKKRVLGGASASSGEHSNSN